MDFDASVFIITSDGQCISENEFDGSLDGDGVFVMLTNDRLNNEFGADNSVCVHRDWFEAVNKAKDIMSDDVHFGDSVNHNGYVSCIWQTEWKAIPGTFKLNAYTDDPVHVSMRNRSLVKFLDGQMMTREIMRNVPALDPDSLESYIPAIMTAYNTRVVFRSRLLHGYLPAIGQLIYTNENIDMLNRALEMIGSRPVILDADAHSHLSQRQWWSANESDYYGAWFLSRGSVYIGSKEEPRFVMPLFAI